MGGHPRLIDFLDSNYKYTPISYGNPGEEPFQGYAIIAFAATAIVLVLVAAALILLKRRRHFGKGNEHAPLRILDVGVVGEGDRRNIAAETSNIPMAGGVLAILTSLIVFAITTIDVQGIFSYWTYKHGQILSADTIFYFYMAIAILGAFAVPLGLVTGVFAIQRRRLRFTLFGLGLLTAYGVIVLVPFYFFGLPVLALSIIADVCVTMFRADFNKKL